jgi:hypothetical protein
VRTSTVVQPSSGKQGLKGLHRALVETTQAVRLGEDQNEESGKRKEREREGESARTSRTSLDLVQSSSTLAWHPRGAFLCVHCTSLSLSPPTDLGSFCAGLLHAGELAAPSREIRPDARQDCSLHICGVCTKVGLDGMTVVNECDRVSGEDTVQD